MTGIRWQMAARSDTGRVRRRNEDSLALDESAGIAVLADGMGGLRDGDVASSEACATVLGALREAPDPGASDAPLCAAFAAANERIRRLAGSGAGMMGTTLVAFCLSASGICRVANVGDSRAYHYRGGTLTRVTRDHSLVQELVDGGQLSAAAARQSPERNVITRAVGLEADLQVDTVALSLCSGDLLLLCSDGLWDMLDDARLAALLAACAAGDDGLQACADRLVAAANEAGGHDNVSLILLRV